MAVRGACHHHPPPLPPHLTEYRGNLSDSSTGESGSITSLGASDESYWDPGFGSLFIKHLYGEPFEEQVYIDMSATTITVQGSERAATIAAVAAIATATVTVATAGTTTTTTVVAAGSATTATASTTATETGTTASALAETTVTF